MTKTSIISSPFYLTDLDTDTKALETTVFSSPFHLTDLGTDTTAADTTVLSSSPLYLITDLGTNKTTALDATVYNSPSFPTISATSESGRSSAGPTTRKKGIPARLPLRKVFKHSRLANATQGSAAEEFQRSGLSLRQQRRAVAGLEDIRNDLLVTLAKSMTEDFHILKDEFKNMRRKDGAESRQDMRIRNRTLLSEFANTTETERSAWSDDEWATMTSRIKKESARADHAKSILENDIQSLVELNAIVRHDQKSEDQGTAVVSHISVEDLLGQLRDGFVSKGTTTTRTVSSGDPTTFNTHQKASVPSSWNIGDDSSFRSIGSVDSFNR